MKVFRFRLVGKFPLVARRGQTMWLIEMHYPNKGTVNLTATRKTDGRVFHIAGGRRSHMEAEMGRGLRSVPGTIRHDLFLDLAARGDARVSVEDEPEEGELIG